MTKVDLKDAYFMVPIHEEDRAFLKFSFKEKKTYQFKCIPFGLACAPWVFTKTLKPLANPCYGPSIFTREPRVCDKQTQVCPGTYTVSGVPRLLSKFSSSRTKSSGREGEEDQGRDPVPFGERSGYSQKAVTATRQTTSSNQSNSPGSSVLPQAAAGTAEGSRSVGTGLFSPINPLHRGEGEAGMVVGPSVFLEWQDHYDRQTLFSDRIRCLHSRLGSILQRGTDWGPLVLRGETVAYQLPGSVGSLPCSKMLCQRQEEHYCATQNGQHHSSHICEQAGWNSVPQTEHHSQGTMALVHEQRHYSGCRTSARSPQYNCGPRIPSNEGLVRLDVESQDLQEDPTEMGSTRSGHVRIQTDNSAEKVLQLEARPRSRSSECLQPELEQPTGEGLCQPPLEPSRQSAEQSTTATSHTGPSGSSMEESAVVSHPTGDASRLSNPPPIHGGSNHTNTPRGCTSSTASTSRMAYLRQRFQDKEISEEGTELLLASWRQKSSKSYDSLFRKWVDWCNQQHSDPVSGPISEVVNFLAHMFKEGYQYRSLNAYRSAISSVHEKVDGYEVGQHPLVSRLLKGVFNQRPPKPRYEVT